jgi:hypothetical protein
MLTSRCESYQWYSILTAHIFWGVFLWKQLYSIRYQVVILLCEITSNWCKPLKHRIYLHDRKYE